MSTWLDKIKAVTICTGCCTVLTQLGEDGECPNCGCENNLGPRLLNIGEIMQQDSDNIFYPDIDLAQYLKVLFGEIEKLKGETK